MATAVVDALSNLFPKGSLGSSLQSPTPETAGVGSKPSPPIPRLGTSLVSDSEAPRKVVVDLADALACAGVPRAYVVFGTKPLDVFTEAQRRSVTRFLLDKPVVVLLYGAPGTGKTRIGTWLLANHLHSEHSLWRKNPTEGFEPQVRWITGHRLLQGLKAYADEGFDPRQALAEFTRVQLRGLLIDDAFPRRMSDTDIDNISELVERRRTNDQLTILTTNKDFLDIEGMSGRLADRLRECAVAFTGESFRGEDAR